MNIWLFSAIFALVMAFLDYYIYRRFLHVALPKFSKLSLTFVALLFLSQMSYIATSRLELVSLPLLFYYLFSLSIGISFILFVVALFYDLSLSLSRKIAFDKSRRKSLKIIFDVTMLVAAFSYLFAAIAGGLKKPFLHKVSLKVEGLEGLKIAQLSDMHIGPILQKAFVQECVECINALHVDMVVITGDLLDGNIDTILEYLQPLNALKSRYGTFYVNGNHEYYHGAEHIMQKLSTLDLTVLSDESLIIDGRFNLVGLNDLASLRFGAQPLLDIDRAFKEVKHELPTIVLAHQPKMVEMLENEPYNLMLSGHTHGGQIFPFGFLVMLAQKYLAGLYQIDKNRQIFVSRGTGYWGPPVRFLAPSEIVVITL